MTQDEFEAAIRKIIPGAEIVTDNFGQVVIYTNLEEKPNGNLEEFSPPEDD